MNNEINKEQKNTQEQININVINKPNIKETKTTTLILNIEKWKIQLLKDYSNDFNITFNELIKHIQSYIFKTIENYFKNKQQYNDNIHDFKEMLKYKPNTTHQEIINNMKEYINKYQPNIKYEIFTTNNILNYRIENLQTLINRYEKLNNKLTIYTKQNQEQYKINNINFNKVQEQTKLKNKIKQINEYFNEIITKLYEQINNTFLNDIEKTELIKYIENENNKK